MGNGNFRRFAYGSRAPASHKIVGLVIASLIKDETPDAGCYASMETLATMCGKNMANVRKSRNFLAGLPLGGKANDPTSEIPEIRLEHRGGRRTSLMFINWDLLKPPPDLDTDVRSATSAQEDGPVGLRPSQTASSSARQRAHMPLGSERTRRSATSAKPQVTPRNEGRAPSAASAVPPPASPPGKFVAAWDALEYRELSKATVERIAKESGTTLGELWNELRLVRQSNTMFLLTEEADRYRPLDEQTF